MSPEARTTVTVAILSGDPLVGRALELLLEGAGHEVGLLEVSEALRVEDLLQGVDFLLLDRGLSDGRLEDLSGRPGGYARDGDHTCPLALSGCRRDIGSKGPCGAVAVQDGRPGPRDRSRPHGGRGRRDGLGLAHANAKGLGLKD